MARISLSLALIEPKTVYIRNIKQKGLLHGGPAVIFAPNEAWEVINSTTFTGWDWQSEKYIKYQQQIRGWNKNRVWAYPGYSGSLERLIDNLHSKGFKVNYDESLPAIDVEHALMEIGLTPDYDPNKGQSTPKTKKVQYKNRTESSKELYPRTRFLWKEHHTRFNEWETKFVKSIGTQLKENKALTDKQRAKLYDMFEKFEVPHEATASSEIGKLVFNIG